MNVVTKANLAEHIDTIKNAKVREAVKACWLGENDGVFRGINITLHPLAQYLLDQGHEINTDYLRFVPHVSNVRTGMMAHAPNKKMLLREGEPLFRRATPVAVLSLLFPSVPVNTLRKQFNRWAFELISPRLTVRHDPTTILFVENGSARFSIKRNNVCTDEAHITIKALTPEYLDVAKRVVKLGMANIPINADSLRVEMEIVKRVA